jgi:D-glycero-alpha-D-manno-heptose-7-phosphate kinase
MILSKTPYRVALSGGGTDLDFYYKKRGGSLYALAIDQYVYVLLCSRELDNNYFIQTTDSHFSKNIGGIKHKLIRETLKYYKVKEKLHICTFSTVPTRTGLGTSSATLIGLINCIKKFKKLKITNKEIIQDAYKIERKICGYKGGWQDQAISQLGGLIKLNISKKENIKFKHIKISEGIAKLINNHLLLVYTKKKRESSKVIALQKKNSNLIEIYDDIKSLNTKFLRVINNKNFYELAKIFNLHWQIKKRLSIKISDNNINKLYDMLITKYNCLGAKLIGAGGGGFFLVVVKNKKKTITEFKKNNISYLELKPEYKGSIIIDNNKNKFNL